MAETDLDFRITEINELIGRVGLLESRLSGVEDRLTAIVTGLAVLVDELAGSERTQRLILTEVRTLAATVKKLIPIRPFRPL